MLETVVVDIGAAIICFMSTCYPALVGTSTPTGEFQLTHYSTELKGYGGDLLVFQELDSSVFAIHRLLNIQNRSERIKSQNPADHVITAGCINLDPTVYDLLVDCCSDSKVVIK